MNLAPPSPLLQSSYGAYATLAIQPPGSKWDEDHALSTVVRNSKGEALYTEVVVMGPGSLAQAQPLTTTVEAGQEVRFRVLNSNASGTAGSATNTTNVIAIEGHGWPEEPWQNASTEIGENLLTQFMGTQQVTPLESYNMVLEHAGGAETGTQGSYQEYDYYYYPKGPDAKLGTLKVQF